MKFKTLLPLLVVFFSVGVLLGMVYGLQVAAVGTIAIGVFLAWFSLRYYGNRSK